MNEARTIRSLLGYREKTAGGIMTPEVTTVTEDMSVQKVIDSLREEAAEREGVYYIYVVDEDRRLEGVISLRDLVISEPDTLVADLLSRDVTTVGPDDDQEIVAETMSKYDLLALPVVDESGKLLGIVTVDDALEVLEEESAEDLAIATGATHEHGPLAGLWWWLVRRNAWLLVWGIAFLAFMGIRGPLTDAMEGSGEPGPVFGLMLMSWALVLLPLLLRTAEDLSSRTLTELIEDEDEDERITLGRRLAREAGIGLATAILSALVALGFVMLTTDTVHEVATPFAAATAAASLLTVLMGGMLGHIALRRSSQEKPVSGTGLAITAMLLGTVVYLGLSYAAGATWAASLVTAGS